MHVMSSDPEIMDYEDDFFGKKRRARRKAQRRAKRAAKKRGIKGKAARRIGRAARQKVRGEQLRAKAARKGGKRGRRLIKRATRIEARKGETAVGRGIRTASFAPLAPFRKPMQRALRKAGVANPPSRLRDLAPMFFKKIVKRDSYELSDNVEPATIGMIVKAIIGFFKKMFKKKQEGAELPPVGEIVAEGAQTAVRALSRKHAKLDVDQGFGRIPAPSEMAVVALKQRMAPLRGVMSSALKNKGVQPPSDIQDLTISFYNRVVQNSPNNYTGLDYADETKGKTDSVLFQTIVPAVIGFITAIKRKKEAGEPMSKVEETIADKTERVEATIADKARGEAEARTGKFILKPTTMIIIGVAVVGLIVLIAQRRG